MNCPEILTIGFVWDAEQSDLTEDVVRSLAPHLNLSGLFYRVMDEKAKRSELILVGMICFSSRHYCTFAYHTKSAKWVLFDDATVKEIGSKWKDVASKCIRGHFQPLLLFYSNPDGSAVSTEDAPRQTSLWPHYKSPINGETAGPEVPSSGSKKPDASRENAGGSGPGGFKPKHQAPSSQGFGRSSGPTSAGRGPVKAGPSDPKGKLREGSKECARGWGGPLPPPTQEGGGEGASADKTPDTPETPSRRRRTPGPPRPRAPAARGREGVRQPGKGQNWADRTSHQSRPSHESRLPTSPPTSHAEAGGPTGRGGRGGTRGAGGAGEERGRSRSWKPVREVLNVDSVLSELERRLRSSAQERAPQRERERARARDERKQKSLMTIYEDEQRLESGSRSSLESDTRDGRGKGGGGAGLKLRSDNWTIQRTESGYESSDRLSNGSTNPDSPVVENFAAKELRPSPEAQQPRSPLRHGGRCEDSRGDPPRPAYSYADYQVKIKGKDGSTQDAHFLKSSPSIRRRFRHPHGGSDRRNGADREPPPLVSDRGCRTGSPTLRHQGSPALQHQGKTSSSEWNSSDDLAGPFSEQEDSAYRSSNSETAPLESPAPRVPRPAPSPPERAPAPAAAAAAALFQPDLAPASPKHAHRHVAESRSSFRPRLLQEPSQTSPRPSPKSAPSPHRPPLRPPAQTVGLLGGTPPVARPRRQGRPRPHGRSDSSASESSDRFPSPRPSPEPPGPGDGVALTTYFTVDNCMTDTYRLKYHHQRVALEPRGGDRGDPGDANHAAPAEPEHLKPRPESGYSTSKPTAKWNPVTPKGLDEHGFL
ncbi:hypothetical protein ANANG_G00095230 [Anguilla anguilla]|uniref:USP domain-containing protein n=1 Tax=Anguilla anguilla TaxID=7936 RepID=A0A9D3MG96_ANGAN|nr:hypothetical protein ANANG_G00095230 [Anguilla anguilla]